MKKIALDFDSVLSDTMIAWTIKYNEKHGTKYTKDHIESWSFWKQKEFSFDKPYADIFFRKSWEDWPNLPFTEDNLGQKVDILSEFGIVDVVTGVDETHLHYVEKWLIQNNIEVNELKHAGEEKISLNYDLFIDDSPDLADKAQKKNKKCFVYHQKWNSEIKENNYVTRINNLIDAITNISNKGL